jgi:hypothetical protein
VTRRSLVPPSALWCGVLIAALKLALRVSGFAPTMRWIRSRTDTRGRDADPAAIQAIAYQVALAAALYPGRARCLEQSLTLFYLLRRRGIDVQFRLGVQPHPFSAHAWVEHAGVPVNDVPEHVGHFLGLPEFTP